MPVCDVLSKHYLLQIFSVLVPIWRKHISTNGFDFHVETIGSTVQNIQSTHDVMS